MEREEYCFFHDPAKEGERRAAQAKGGRNRLYAAAPGPLACHFDLRDRHMRAEILNFAANQVLGGRIDSKVGYLLGFLVNIARADQAATLKQPENLPTCESDEIPLLQLPENAIRRTLDGYTRQALEDLYEQIVARQECDANDPQKSEDSSEDSSMGEVGSSLAAEQAPRTSIQSLKAAVVYFLNSQFWKEAVDYADQNYPGYKLSYYGDATEFLRLPEYVVRSRLSTFATQALQDLLQQIDKLKQQKPKALPSDEVSSGIPLPLGMGSEVSVELLESMARFFLNQRRAPFDANFARSEPLSQQGEPRNGPSQVTNGEPTNPIDRFDRVELNPASHPPELQGGRTQTSKSGDRVNKHPGVHTPLDPAHLNGGFHEEPHEGPSAAYDVQSEPAPDEGGSFSLFDKPDDVAIKLDKMSDREFMRVLNKSFARSKKPKQNGDKRTPGRRSRF